MNMDGFKVGVNEYDTDFDLQLCYGTFIPAWSNVLYSIINWENTLPSGEATDFVQGCYGDGYAFFWYSKTKFHPNLMDIPAIVFAKYLTQEGWTFVDYLNDVLFYYMMIVFKHNQKEAFDDVIT